MSTLNYSQLQGVVDDRFSGNVTHYRGIPYSHIPQRFAAPELVTQPEPNLDATKFGPRCPQIFIDQVKYYRIPEHIPPPVPEEQDELKCTNLNITCPQTRDPSVPVFIYIHGGAQAVSWTTAQQRGCDPGPMVAHSVEIGKPIILVTVNYRLGVFAYGDNEGEKNLALQDLLTSVEWVRSNIKQFGGDPGRITLGGESAGGHFVHALVAAGAPVQRAFMASGQLYLTPPLPAGFAAPVLTGLSSVIQKYEPGKTLRTAKAEAIVQAATDLALSASWLQLDPRLEGWQDDEKVFGRLEALMVGDCENEAFLFQIGIMKTPAADIMNCFAGIPADAAEKIKKAYHISDEAPHRGVLQFVNDARFPFVSCRIAERLKAKTKTKTFQYIFDEINPWAPKGVAANSAQHGIDLLAYFGGYDEFLAETNPGFARVGREFRDKLVSFVRGEEPWSARRVYAFGPEGECRELSEEGLGERRRLEQFRVLEDVGEEVRTALWVAVTVRCGFTLDE